MSEWDSMPWASVSDDELVKMARDIGLPRVRIAMLTVSPWLPDTAEIDLTARPKPTVRRYKLDVMGTTIVKNGLQL